mgnify:CR=1 FL=1
MVAQFLWHSVSTVIVLIVASDIHTMNSNVIILFLKFMNFEIEISTVSANFRNIRPIFLQSAWSGLPIEIELAVSFRT